MKTNITREAFTKQDFVLIIEGVKDGLGPQKIAEKHGRPQSSVAAKIVKFGGRGAIIARLIAGESPEDIANYWWKKMGRDTLKERQALQAAKARSMIGAPDRLDKIEEKLDLILRYIKQSAQEKEYKTYLTKHLPTYDIQVKS